MTSTCLASIERAIGELKNASRQKREFPGSFLAATYTGFAIHHLRAAARAAPLQHRMRLARLAALLRTSMRRLGLAPHDAELTVIATMAHEIADSQRTLDEGD